MLVLFSVIFVADTKITFSFSFVAPLRYREYVYGNYLLPIHDARNFDIHLSFLIKEFFYMTKNVSTNNKCLKNKKSFLR